MADEDTKPRGLDRAEQLARLLSLVALPVVLAVLAAVLNTRQVLTHDYIELATSILKEPEKSDMTQALREWAVDVLNQDAPVKFSDDLVNKLKTGKAVLPIASAPLHNEARRIQLAQQLLQALDWYQGPSDGKLDNETYLAVVDFQRKYQLTTDGYPGGETLRKLQDVCNEAEGKGKAKCPTKMLPTAW